MAIEETIDIKVSPEQVMSCYRNVAAWPEWDPDTGAASIDGPFRTGARGKLRPTKGFAVPMHFVSVTEHSFTVDCPPPLCVMRFEHELMATTQATRVTHRVSFSGPLARFFEWLVGTRVRAGLPHTLANLKKLLEAAPTPSQQIEAR